MSESFDDVAELLRGFAERVYWVVDQVPLGTVATYGQIATYAGSPGAARAVGNLMRDSAANGFDVPWHRIINASGGISSKGDFARAELQRLLLEKERVAFDHRGKCVLARFVWSPQDTFWNER